MSHSYNSKHQCDLFDGCETCTLKYQYRALPCQTHVYDYRPSIEVKLRHTDCIHFLFSFHALEISCLTLIGALHKYYDECEGVNNIVYLVSNLVLLDLVYLLFN